MASKKLVTETGRAVFSNLTQPRENPNSGKLEWQIGLILTEEDCEPLLQAIEEAVARKRATDPSFPETGYHMPIKPSMKPNDAGEKVPVDGEFLVNFKRQYHLRSKTGEDTVNTAPALYDANGRVVTAQISRVPGGSMGRVIYEPYVYSMKGAKGVSLQLHGFQIAELADESVPLAPISGGWVPEEDEDDEVPF